MNSFIWGCVTVFFCGLGWATSNLIFQHPWGQELVPYVMGVGFGYWLGRRSKNDQTS